MKYYLLLFTLLMGCGESKNSNVNASIESVEGIASLPLRRGTAIIRSIEIEGCEYYYDFNTALAVPISLTHKGNCKNHSLHRDWMRELSEKQNNTIGK